MERRNQTNDCTAFQAEGKQRAEALVSKDWASLRTAQKQSAAPRMGERQAIRASPDMKVMLRILNMRRHWRKHCTVQTGFYIEQDAKWTGIRMCVLYRQGHGRPVSGDDIEAEA